MYKTEISKVTIENNVVVKEFFSTRNTKVGKAFDREMYWLTKLSGFDRTPNIIDAKYPKIFMTYMGKRISLKTTPSDWEHQLKYIVSKLKQYNCSHNDIKPEEILTMNGRINLVDFNWATKISEPIPSNWPTGLGDERFRLGIHSFNDEFSFRRSIKYVMEIKDE